MHGADRRQARWLPAEPAHFWCSETTRGRSRNAAKGSAAAVRLGVRRTAGAAGGRRAAAPAWRSSARIICDCAAFSRGRLASSTARRSAKSSVCAAAARSSASWSAISRASARAAASASPAPAAARPSRRAAPRAARAAPRPPRGGVLLGVEPGELLGDGGEGLRHVAVAEHRAQRREARRHLALGPVQRLEPHREVVERGAGSASASAATCGASASQLGELRLERRQPGEDRSTAASFWA